ncbi:MAG: hypothetical protein KAJ19_13285 [Gammaproteobacteria bacterium]|nr:hypothetical protein [Gammaproteobacteria bacterium]
MWFDPGVFETKLEESQLGDSLFAWRARGQRDKNVSEGEVQATLIPNSDEASECFSPADIAAIAESTHNL